MESAAKDKKGQNSKEDKMTKLYVLELIMPVIMLLSLTLVSFFVVMYISNSGIYPAGADTMYEMHRGNFIYNNWMKGVAFPVYDPTWYNGIELLRVEPPLVPYLIALCLLFMRGNAYISYLLFVILLLIVGCTCWYVVGMRENRPVLGWMMGILWFFMPTNLYTLFGEGNLGRAMVNALLPLFIFYVSNYLMYGSWRIIPKLIAVYSVIALSSLNYSGMLFIAAIFYMVVYLIANRTARRFRRLFGALCLPYAVIGLWLYNAVKTGVIDFGNAETVGDYFQTLFISVNPFFRTAVSVDVYYFGLATFLICIFGVICSKRKQIPGFLTAVLILLFSTELFFPLLSLMPAHRFFLMLKYLPVAACLGLLSLLQWRTLKKELLLFCLIFLCIDVLPSLWFIRGYGNGKDPADRYTQIIEETLIGEAKEMTRQRLAFLDGGDLGSTGAYLITDFGDKIMSTYGYGWEGAATKRNINQLELALQDGYYPYIFDRMLQLGNDSVIIKKDKLMSEEGDPEYGRLKEAAKLSGYDVVDENSKYIFFHQDISGNWGTVEKYKGIGIGSAAATLSLAYPTIEETEEDNLNNYTFDELSKYDVIYLSEFTYDSLSDAEELIKRLADNGNQIVILADGIPENRENRMKVFLGVTCNLIKFKNSYPELETVDYGVLNCDLFPLSYADWSCYYVNGLDKVQGKLTDAGAEIDFYGTVYNDNIHFIGLNIPLYYYLTEDPSIGKIMYDVMMMEPGTMPERKVAPMDIVYTPTGISISCKELINTGLGIQDCFSSERPLISRNYLMAVEEGTTDITFIHPYFWQGLSLTLLGLALTVLYTIYLKKRSMDSES